MFSKHPEARHVLGFARHPVLPPDLQPVEVLGGGVVGGAEEGRVIAVRRGVDLGANWQQLLQLCLEPVIKSRQHCCASGEEN